MDDFGNLMWLWMKIIIGLAVVAGIAIGAIVMSVINGIW